jgi:hypothetical protein
VVGIYVLTILLFVLNRPWEQSLVVQLLISMVAPIYDFSLEETLENTILSFTNCDNHTNEIAVCEETYSLELLHLVDFTSLNLH